MSPTDQDFLNYLEQFVTENKQRLIDEALNKRTRHITVVLEDIYQPQNASAVIRTCDCYGIQDVHIVEDRHVYNVNPRVVHGAAKWITLHRYNEDRNNSETCIQKLKKEGFKIVATVPKPDVTSIYDLDISEKTAVVFGTEKHGISDYTLQEADELVTVPMYGFTESLNISVSAAICLSAIAEKLYKSDVNWQFEEKDKTLLRLSWYKNIVQRAELLE
ncbi:MAG: RNA methyltransferase, partial [Bacteroidota bacterium]